MIPNKKGLQVIMKNTFTPGWENRIFTLTGEKQINDWVPLNSLKLLILNKQEKEN